MNDSDSPLRDYALVGDCHGSALVSRDGSVDWCALGRFDADPVFCRILDRERGGFLAVVSEGETRCDRTYLGSTNVLRTTIAGRDGTLGITDFMPVGRAPGSGVHDYVTLRSPGWFVRILEGVEGVSRVTVRYRPSVEFARRRPKLFTSPSGVLAEGGLGLCSDLEFSVVEDMATARADLRPGERRILVVSASPIDAACVDRWLAVTTAFWEEWAAYCRYDGPYREAVLRSALALKMLTYAPSGAIVAAPTTSLPEEIGGERNWDYRFCWVRDAMFTVQAFAALGYSGEAGRLMTFLRRACAKTHPEIQIMYGIEGETELREKSLDHLAGYRGSRPVRVGNGAYSQRQLDVYGEVLDWALMHRSLGGRLDRETKMLLRSIPDYVAAHWREPGQGPWEMRGEPLNHVFGKTMCWVAMDRAIRMFGARDDWVSLRREIERSILTRGISAGGHLLQAFDRPGTDAALLLAWSLGFPVDSTVFERTVAAIRGELGSGDFLRRYATEDGVPGDEGAFLICSFWEVDALLALGRVDDARGRFETLLKRANDVGLYSEQIDPATGGFLGNFPQAFTHLALILCAVHFDLFEKHGPGSLRGTQADRSSRAVEAIAGVRALWAAFKKTRRVGRIRSSRASIVEEKRPA